MQLAETLRSTADPKQLADTLQSYAQENLQEVIQYWDHYRRIVQDTEQHLLTSGEKEAKPERKARAPRKAQAPRKAIAPRKAKAAGRKKRKA